MNEIKTITFDARGQSVGRLASRIAFELLDKTSPNYRPNVAAKKRVVVQHARDMKLTGKKMEQETYKRHSGYLGGLKSEKFAGVFAKDPADMLRRAVWNMLPRNRLHQQRMKMLIIQND